jgi:hypothetical protein
MSLFYSSRRLDATPAGEHTVSAIRTDGLHRLVRDREKTGILPMQTWGGHIRYLSPALRVGLTALHYTFGDYTLRPDPKPYNLFYFSGSRNTNLGVDYLLRTRRLKIFGETAVSANKALASLNALQLTPSSSLSFLILYRYYDKRYQAYFGNAFSQNTSPQNEQGLYMNLQFTPFACWSLSMYADFFRFPWLKYGVDAPSSGREYMVEADYTQLENFSFSLRYKYKQKEKNGAAGDEPLAPVLPYAQRRARLQLHYRLLSFAFKTSGEGILYGETEKQSKGYLLAQSLAWKPSAYPFQADVYAACFHTDDYNSSLSSYEKNILYAFHTPRLYGKGIRLSATLRWDLAAKLSLFTKLSCTRYADRDTIGTELEEIEGNHKTEIALLLRWKF